MKREALILFLLGLLVTVDSAHFALTLKLMDANADLRERMARIEATSAVMKGKKEAKTNL